MAQHNDLGRRGEEMAVQYLLQKGYKVLERNWHFGKEEVDIIATLGVELVVVEVKTRNSAFFGEPQTFVSRSKQQHLVRAAHAYVTRNDHDLEVRFDVIGIVLNALEERLEHVEGAFLPRW
jgi:putative endonuclease